ncbi:MAG TPA: DUF4126 family protein [Candidatus Acidoferrales bacterium]
MNMVLLLAVGIGVVAGLRSLTAPAVVCWMAHFHVLNLQDSHLRFMGSTIAVAVFTLLALVEIINDKLPKTPSRTTAVPLTARILMGALSGAAFGAAGARSVAIAAIAGIIGALIGTFGGYQVRTRTVKALHAPDFVIALLEDAVAIGGGLLLASRF